MLLLLLLLFLLLFLLLLLLLLLLPCRYSLTVVMASLQVNFRAIMAINEALGLSLGENEADKGPAKLGGIREGGRVVMMSSINGIAGAFGQTNYAFTKAGLIECVLPY